MHPLLRSEKGAVSVFALSIAVIAFFALAGLLNVRLQWRIRVREQFRLDRCVEKTALDLEKIQERIRVSNLQMIAIRVAAYAAAVPSAGQSLKAAQPLLEAERLWQELQLTSWKIQQLRWVAKRGCDGKNDLFFPLPNLKWDRPPPDSAGPMHLRWTGSENEKLKIRLWRLPNFSSAEVALEKTKWKADWASVY